MGIVEYSTRIHATGLRSLLGLAFSRWKEIRRDRMLLARWASEPDASLMGMSPLGRLMVAAIFDAVMEKVRRIEFQLWIKNEPPNARFYRSDGQIIPAATLACLGADTIEEVADTFLCLSKPIWLEVVNETTKETEFVRKYTLPLPRYKLRLILHETEQQDICKLIEQLSKKSAGNDEPNLQLPDLGRRIIVDFEPM